MRIYGIEITPEQEAAMVARMKSHHFRAYQIERVAESAGVPPLGISMRAAERVIQRHRKAGNIKQVSPGLWQWIGEK